MNKTKFSVVIPVYCENSQIKHSLARIKKEFEALNDTYEMIVVDDGSTDKTWNILEQEANIYPELKIIRLSRNFGKESAISAGLDCSVGEAVIVMDSDLQHPPELIHKMIQIWRDSKVDVVNAVKYNRGKESFINKMGAKFFYASLNKLSGFKISNSSDFKLLDRQVIDAWKEMDENNLFFRGMITWLGFKHVEIPFTVQQRKSGVSKWSLFRLIQLALNAISAFSSLPLHIITVLGFVVLIIAIILGVQSLIHKLSGEALEGFTTVIITQLFIGSIIMISLGIIGIYLARIYEEVKRRPRYVVSQIINKNKQSSK